MIVLDTDHLSVLKYDESPACQALRRRLKSSGSSVTTTIVCVEEQLRGWLSYIKAQPDAVRQVMAYSELQSSLRFFQLFQLLAYDLAAARIFGDLKRQRIRVGTQDLKIAAMVLANDATLLSRNLKDFAKVPG
jgi:tRNA(fMet)-specific endonuclease VapC